MKRLIAVFALIPSLAFAEVYPARTPHAVIVFVLSNDSNTPRRFDLKAADVHETAGVVRSATTLQTPAGSEIEVVDVWTADGDAQHLRRDVTIRQVGSGDTAFGTGAEFDTAATTLANAEVFMPGVWYGTAEQTPPSALIHDVGQTDFLIREDRMALPLVSVRDCASGETRILSHDHPDGGTIAADVKLERTVDARFQFGSIGLRRDREGALRLAFRFPGTEGEQTSIGGFKSDRRSAERFHPLKVGATQHYELTLRSGKADDFADQLRQAWRPAFTQARPSAESFNASLVYEASVSVLAHYAYDKGKVAGIPFGVSLPGGMVKDRSLQIGFIGQQPECASYLIDDGLRRRRTNEIAQGERIVDFWSRESLSPAGVPRTWYDVDPAPKWRDYPTYLRVTTDGASGVLRAWQIERSAGRDKPAWLQFCKAVGDWLLRIQNADGSFYRSWNFDGAPNSKSLTSTLHPVRFLVDLTCATGNKTYEAAAVRAAGWSVANGKPGRYVGGTPDNPDVIDKEAGWIAFDSFLALYDVTQDSRWLNSAVAAATYTETWIYGWNLQLPPDASKVQIPRLKTTAGACSLIATGHSGADLFLAYSSFAYARLALYTGDSHFAELARMLQANTGQFVDVKGSLGYATPGLCVEAFGLVGGQRGSSVATWLPWCTSAILEPMARCREVFGTVDVAAALQLDTATLKQKQTDWAKTRGFQASLKQ